MISNTHRVAQKTHGRQLNAKVCGSESTSLFNNNNSSSNTHCGFSTKLPLILVHRSTNTQHLRNLYRLLYPPLFVYIWHAIPTSPFIFTDFSFFVVQSYTRKYHKFDVKALCRQEQLDASFGDRKRKIHRDPAGNRTRDLLITSWTIYH